MKLEIKRETLTDNSTVGSLYVDGVRECYTLEDKVREIPGAPVSAWKVPHETAIPVGKYLVIIDYSPRFNRDMPHVLDVPGFDGVRIHSGNTAQDTEGCILVGRTKSPNFVGLSRLAFVTLMEKLETAYDKNEQILLEITHDSR